MAKKYLLIPTDLNSTKAKAITGDKTKRKKPEPNAILNLLLCLTKNFLSLLAFEYFSLHSLNF